jgi:hypothetical protein
MEKKKIQAKIVADSVAPNGKRITTFLLTYPRMIHSELMTHRLFSRNAASSRAIPFSKMIDQIQEDPFIPIAWQKKHSGMQGTEYIENPSYQIDTWLKARDNAVAMAKRLDLQNATKQIVNRLIEPWVWYNVLITATEYDNFFELRCPKYKPVAESDRVFKSKLDAIYEGAVRSIDAYHNDTFWRDCNQSGAEIHIQALAESMWDERSISEPKQLKEGEWHIPFGDRIDVDQLEYVSILESMIKIATARAARLSYNTFDGEINYEKDIALHDRLLASRHMSPFEHCAKAMGQQEYYEFINGEVDEVTPLDIRGMSCSVDSSNCIKLGNAYPDDKIFGWCMNFNGFIPYRYIVEQHNSRK